MSSNAGSAPEKGLFGAETDEYVKIAEAARLLGVSQNTLRTWADDGKISARVNPANGYRLFRRADLESFLCRVAKSPTNRRKAK
ncbi:MAG: helix-turn-helix domain-containing protein [Planctomycetia bacterium]|nr:helix-turn-helix domain-containing protein [Planctomycetia bacterium]